MTIRELIKILEKKPQDLLVVYRLFSEQCLVEEHDIKIEHLCEAREDGWVHDERPDKPTVKYLVLPGN